MLTTNRKSMYIISSKKYTYTCKYADNTPMADHVTKMLNIWNCIAEVGKDLPDIHIAHALILSLSKTTSWDLIKIQLFTLDSLSSKIVA